MQIEPDNRPLNIGPRLMPKRRKEDVEEGEFYEEEDEYEEVEVVNEQGEVSLSKKRRERRKRLEKKFNVMKSGKFHLIQELFKDEAERK
uniref:Uncharacterized protein n=1 Tax=Panagrolaimus sp. JU765 TaxID=591449 RepID=A0AC34QGH3_9BILA